MFRMNSSLSLFVVAVAVLTLSAQARDTDRDTPLGTLFKSIFNPSRGKPVKSGIVEPSAIIDSSEVGEAKETKDDDMDLADFLTPTKNKKKARSESKRREGFLSGIFRSLTGDQETSASNIDEVDEDTTTKRPSLFRPLFGGNRIVGAIRNSARDGWRSFLKTALPALFS